MARLVPAHWEPTFEGMSRADRRGCDYEAYVPDPLAGWQPRLPADLVADLADAEAAVRALTTSGISHVSLEGLARFLLRAEAVGSSRIEGLDAAPRRLLTTEALLAEGGDAADRVAVEILGNIDAMQVAVDLAAHAEEIMVSDLLSVHRHLMDRSPTPQLAGKVREAQNWIGGSDYTPCGAAFVPPPSEEVPALLEDLILYVNGDDHSPLVQAALAHAQFETIHPFGDGNGRTGRALIHVILRRRGLAERFVPPVSLVLATWSRDYIAGLTAFRHTGEAASDERAQGAEEWVRTFAAATRRACADAQTFAGRITELDDHWRAQIGPVRRRSAVDLLLAQLPGTPVVTTTSATALIRRSRVRTGEAINRLVDAGVLRQRNVGRNRGRVFEAVGVVDLFIGLERALASPLGDTASSPPVRPVPHRPNP